MGFKRPLVQIQSLGPRRNRFHSVPTSFYACGIKDVIHSVTFVLPFKSEAGGFGFVFSRRFEAGSDKIMRAANSPEIVGFQDSFFAFCLKPAPEPHMAYLCRAKKVCSTFQAIYDTYLIEGRR